MIKLLTLGAVIAVGIYKWIKRKNSERRKQADLARKDLDNAKENDDPSDMLDAFNRLQ